jgi:hypothetical protein
MSDTGSNRSVPQAGNVSFELHTLGWEAFQNLCGHVAREILGQTVTAFSTSNDAGQDGAFQGSWKRAKNETFSGRFVLQCKFTSRRDQHLTLSDLKDEIKKAELLAESGLAETYLLMTNARVSGEADKAIREAFSKIPGLNYFELFGSEWLTQQILSSKRLRALVPRIYGLGDLSQILDERVYQQTEEILETWRDNLSKFVPTEAHHKSIRALFEHGFVLLLGDPMAGKSTIAAALAIAAADQWSAIPVFASSPEDFRTHWNPNEPNQFFWIDDAFGQTQFDPSLAEGWNRTFPHLSAAVRKGAKILFTSRTYVYLAAKRELKFSGFPLIGNSQVVIEVENLHLQEKERILYNHLKLGNQPKEFRAEIKPHLPRLAASTKFFPEIARRLGDPFFTRSLEISAIALQKFVEEPKHFLAEVIQQLDRRSFAALALLFMRAGRVAMPLQVEGAEFEALAQLGADQAQLREALVFLEGSLVAKTFEGGEHAWKFRHPSIRDAMADHVASRADLVDVYLHGVKASELLREVLCGDVKVAGAKVHIPSSRFRIVALKLGNLEVQDWYVRHNLLSFLNTRCSPEFLRIWFDVCYEQFEFVFRTCAVGTYSFVRLVARLHQLRCLPEQHRRSFVVRSKENLLESAEATFLDQDFRDLLTKEELTECLDSIRHQLLPAVDSVIESHSVEYNDIDEEPSEHFQDFSKSIELLRDLFDELNDEKTVRGLERAQELIDEAVDTLNEWKRDQEREAKRKKQEEKEEDFGEQAWLEKMIAEYERRTPSIPRTTSSQATQRPELLLPVKSRNIFDDVDL